MKRLAQLLKTRLPRDLKREFVVQHDAKSIDRLEVVAWMGLILYLGLFYVDILRTEEGTRGRIFDLFAMVHYTGLLFIPPVVTLLRWKQRVRDSALLRGILIYGMLVIMLVSFFSNAILQYYHKGVLTFYFAFIIVANWALAMTHFQRILFNTLSCLIILLVILLPFPEWAEFSFGRNSEQIINVFEAVGVTVVAFILDAFDFNLRVAKFLNEKQLEKEKQRIEELEKFKSRLFTNLTHEFRTPLTIISGIAEQIHANPSKWAKEGPEMIKRNSASLLNLVNQILDLSKLESGNITLKFVHGDVIPYIKYITDSFQSYAGSKDIEIHFLTDVPRLALDYDPDKSLNILSNLLSNAIKYTPENGNIYVRVSKVEKDEGEMLELRVKDTGNGIPEDQIPFIFERFYQVDSDKVSAGSGTGIGLSVVQELTKLMGGTIDVHSTVGEGTEFVLHFPIVHEPDVAPAEFSKSSIEAVASSYVQPALPEGQKQMIHGPRLEEVARVLLIEDNTDVLQYLKSCLEDEYRIVFATDGLEGVEKAKELVPDIIISDVMMPGKDGFEVCSDLKGDNITSHIPIVLLTAKADIASKLEGLDRGADDYLAKPFNPDELRTRLRNLIQTRRLLQQRYNDIDAFTDNTEPENREDAFVAQVRKAVMEHLDDVDFSINDLCRAVGLSRTQLHNKLKAVTGLSASLFVRFIRLRKGRELLLQGALNVSEVAYEVGFRDPNYFTRTFTEEFGMSPSKVRP